MNTKYTKRWILHHLRFKMGQTVSNLKRYASRIDIRNNSCLL